MRIQELRSRPPSPWSTRRIYFQGILLIFCCRVLLVHLLQGSGMEMLVIDPGLNALFMSIYDSPGSNDADAQCIFRQSPLYRKVFVYPSPGTDAFRNNHSGIITNAEASIFPWEPMLQQCKLDSKCGYDLHSELMQVQCSVALRYAVGQLTHILTLPHRARIPV